MGPSSHLRKKSVNVFVQRIESMKDHHAKHFVFSSFIVGCRCIVPNAGSGSTQMTTQSIETTQPRRVSLLARLLQRLLPTTTKRMIFFSSFTAYVRDIHDPDAVLCAKLNDMFSLSENANALKFPMKVSPCIWGDLNVEGLSRIGIRDSLVLGSDEKLAMAKKRIIAKHVVKEMPAWLQYDSNRAMTADIVRLLTTAENIPVPQK